MLPLLSFFQSISHAKDWVSSGGDGVVCFATKQTASRVEDFILRDDSFPLHFLYQVESVISLESFEASLEESFEIAAKAKDFYSLVQEKRNLIKVLSPLFYFQIQLLDDEIRPNQWLAKDQVKEINDSIDRAIVRKKNPRCVLAQIFDRQSLSRSGELPKLKVIYQKQLWEKMSPLDQALLYFHEILLFFGNRNKIFISDYK
jgi:hypothetical protein